MKKRTVRYSEAFKLQVISDLESGRFGSQTEASRAYGITGRETVKRWLQEFGKEHLANRVIKVEKQGEPGELKRLKDRVKKLEAALADAYMDAALEKAGFDILCEQTGTDAASFKKKHVGTESTKRTKDSKKGKA